MYVYTDVLLFVIKSMIWVHFPPLQADEGSLLEATAKKQNLSESASSGWIFDKEEECVE